MNNEPVAWIGKDELQFGFTDTRVTNEKESWDDIPLYTHPVDEKQSKFDGNNKVKELTDEEICKIFNEHTGLGIHQKEADKADLLVFARAILRKAQEK